MAEGEVMVGKEAMMMVALEEDITRHIMTNTHVTLTTNECLMDSIPVVVEEAAGVALGLMKNTSETHDMPMTTRTAEEVNHNSIIQEVTKTRVITQIIPEELNRGTQIMIDELMTSLNIQLEAVAEGSMIEDIEKGDKFVIMFKIISTRTLYDYVINVC